MSKVWDHIEPSVQRFIEKQQLFFVATAPLAAEGHVNVSPKGLSALRVLAEREVAYLDYPGSTVETIAHLRENGRIVLMFCAFEGAPKIVRLHGRGFVLEPADSRFGELLPAFGQPELAPRSIIRIAVERVSDSCGYGVPLYDFRAERDTLVSWGERKGAAGLDRYMAKHNRESIDGLPGVARQKA